MAMIIIVILVMIIFFDHCIFTCCCYLSCKVWFSGHTGEVDIVSAVNWTSECSSVSPKSMQKEEYYGELTFGKLLYMYI